MRCQGARSCGGFHCLLKSGSLKEKILAAHRAKRGARRVVQDHGGRQAGDHHHVVKAARAVLEEDHGRPPAFELAEAITGLRPLSAGVVTVDGRRLRSGDPRDDLRSYTAIHQSLIFCIGAPDQYVNNVAFYGKVLFLVVAGVNAMWFERLHGATVASSYTAGTYNINRVFLYFDTSAVPANATIQSVTLNFYAGQYQNGPHRRVHVV